MNRHEDFEKFLSYFGNGDSELCFRMIHDYMDQKETFANFKKGRSLNFTVQKKSIDPNQPFFTLDNGDKIDITAFNNGGYGIFILPNLAHKKEQVTGEYAHAFDFDCGKVLNQHIKTEEEADEVAKEFRSDSDFISVEIVKKSGRKPYQVIARRSTDAITRLKEAFLNQYEEFVQYALINESPNGFRGFFFRKDTDNANPEEYEMIQKAIISVLGTDEAISHSVQPIRISGFYHTKDKNNPYLVNTIQWPTKIFTKAELKELFKDGITGEITRPPAVKKEKKPAKSASSINVLTRQLGFADTVDLIKSTPITTFFPQYKMSYKYNFSCIYHTDNNPSARLKVSGTGQHYYICGSTQCGKEKSKDVIAMYLEDKYNGSYRFFEKAVIELAAILGIEVIESVFMQQERLKYAMNAKFLSEMFDKDMMREHMPTLYSKFFTPYVRYLKEHGEYVRDENGERIIDIQKMNKRERILRELISYGLGNLKEIEVDGNAIFYISFRRLTALINNYSTAKTEGNNTEFFKKIEHEKGYVIYLVKQLEMIGFLKQVPIDLVPDHIQKKSERLASKDSFHAWRADKNKKVRRETITYYTVSNWYEMIDTFEKNAIELKENGYKTSSHNGKDAIILHQGEEVANQLFQDDRNVSERVLIIRNQLKGYAALLIEEKGFFTREELFHNNNRVRIRKCGNEERIRKSEKERVWDISTSGKNSLLNELNIKRVRCNKEMIQKWNLDPKQLKKTIYVKKEG